MLFKILYFLTVASFAVGAISLIASLAGADNLAGFAVPSAIIGSFAWALGRLLEQLRMLSENLEEVRQNQIQQTMLTREILKELREGKG